LNSSVFASPVKNFESIQPKFDAPRDTKILLVTRSNRNSPILLSATDINTIINSPFDRSRPLRVLTHGWGGDDTTDFISGATPALLDHSDFNILIIDWGEGAQTINYAAAVQRVQPVGVFIGSYLDTLHQNGLIDYSRVSLLGFSLGGSFHYQESLSQLKIT
jgi:pancreatic triacylglycerol lipase